MLLPIEAWREKIVKTVSNSRVTIVNGETGSGKTTKVPRYLYEAGLEGSGRIGVTEPRRIAAIATSEYVANQIGCRVGEKVGFQIRFNDATSEGTKIKFMTSGILLQEAKSDPLFSRYQVLVCDEAHERSIDTDIIIGLAKRAMATRDDLRLVIMSATLQEEKFTRLFPESVAIHVEGRMFPVETRYMSKEDMAEAERLFNPKRGQEVEAYAAYVVNKINRLGLPGDILIFMPGEAEIYRVISFIESLNLAGLTLLPCYGNMNPDEQRRIFAQVPGRKVVIATNIAETSITVDGIVHVVDPGLIKENYFNPETGITMLKTVEHSKSGLEQRKGRAGRTQPGACWRLFEMEHYEKVRPVFSRTWEEKVRPEFTTPEIQRSEISGVILRLIGIGIKDVENFDFIDAPESAIIDSALETLVAIGALTESREITEIGHKVMDLPLDPKLARMILAAEERGCVKEITVIAAILSVRSFFSRPKDKEFEADIAKAKFSDLRSDLLTGLAVIAAYEKSGWDRNWAKANFLNWKAIEEALSIKNQLEEILTGLGIPLTSCGYCLPKDRTNLTSEEKLQGELIGKAVTAAFIQNMGVRNGRSYLKAHRGYTEYYIHPSSVLFKEDAPLVVVTSIAETTKTFGRNCHKVEPTWLQEIAPDKIKVEKSGPRRRYFGDRNVYEFTESVYFAGTFISETNYPAKGPEVTAAIVRDLMNGEIYNSSISSNGAVINTIRTIHWRSGGTTKAPPTSQELTEFYLKRLGDVQTPSEAEFMDFHLNLRNFVSEEEEKEFSSREAEPAISPLESRPSVFTQALHRVLPGVFKNPIDDGIRQRMNTIRSQIAIISQEPEIYGYAGGSGLYILSQESNRIEWAFDWGASDQGKLLLAEVEQEVARAFEHADAILKKRTKKAEADALAREAAQREGEAKKKLEDEWRGYQKKLVELQAQFGKYSGFGIYTFPVVNRFPQEYQENGKTFVLDEDFFEVLPEEKAPHWGYITQWGKTCKVVLLLKVMKKPV